MRDGKRKMLKWLGLFEDGKVKGVIYCCFAWFGFRVSCRHDLQYYELQASPTRFEPGYNLLNYMTSYYSTCMCWMIFCKFFDVGVRIKGIYLGLMIIDGNVCLAWLRTGVLWTVPHGDQRDG
ncbi:hypothetical protein L228DRAFT_83727 [Xylona heveae TC161]|uniref:Uncharacterized protein n=1 Tax=Xylona heveae (strain CBS 132557 / TC161) TaxID=1328760 RepID=A0A161THP7_XYLHT|nr:hypothetical protein L228DRAFT_83727 [Xylona heveae TC161]KZF25787.1 hypothetical protein L228DRAFT_83727 [Xylona heveae TC161]